MIEEHRERIRGCFRIFENNKRLEMSDWVEARRIMPKETPIPGPWKNSRTPYALYPMECFTNEVTEEINLKWGSQLGKTEFINNCLGYTIDEDPRPMLFFLPTDKMAQRYSSVRLRPALESMRGLTSKLRQIKGQNYSSGKVDMKHFEGGFLIIAGSNSPSNFASYPVAMAFLDELDRYPKDIKHEGSALGLVRNRLSNFPRSKLIASSTPTVEDSSQIQEHFETTNKHRYYVPCPFCASKILLEPKYFVERNDVVFHACPVCNKLIPENRKFEIVNAGKWLSENPEKGLKRVGLELSTLYSLFGTNNSSWETLFKGFQDSMVDEKKKKEFWNTKLALPYGVSFQNTISPEDMLSSKQRRPKGYKYCLTTAAIDVQKDRLEMEIHDWSRYLECRPVKHIVFRGDTVGNSVWKKLFEFLLKDKYKIDTLAVDSGYLTDKVISLTKLVLIK